MDALEPIDEIQSHIIGVITGLLISYKLNPDHVKARYDYIVSLPPGATTNMYEAAEEDIVEIVETEVQNLVPIEVGQLWGDMDEDSDPYDVYSLDCSDTDMSEEEGPLFVSTRKQFCATMQKDIKICPRYSTCEDRSCKNFHVKEQYLCPHITRGSYCDVEGCDLIVIRACRKGRRCTDRECSFKHRA